jgi:hypothetical protein
MSTSYELKLYHEEQAALQGRKEIEGGLKTILSAQASYCQNTKNNYQSFIATWLRCSCCYVNN